MKIHFIMTLTREILMGRELDIHISQIRDKLMVGELIKIKVRHLFKFANIL